MKKERIDFIDFTKELKEDFEVWILEWLSKKDFKNTHAYDKKEVIDQITGCIHSFISQWYTFARPRNYETTVIKASGEKVIGEYEKEREIIKKRIENIIDKKGV